MAIVEGFKKCGCCGEVKPISEFHRSEKGDGYQYYCKACKGPQKSNNRKKTKRHGISNTEERDRGGRRESQYSYTRLHPKRADVRP